MTTIYETTTPAERKAAMDSMYATRERVAAPGTGFAGAGFTQQCVAGHFSAYCYRSGSGQTPFATRQAAESWVREQHAKGPIQNYSR
jgi:hypothetical protein